MAASFIRDLNKTNSKLDKVEVFKKTLMAAKLGSVTAQRFLRLAKATYNPFVVYGVRQIPETNGIVTGTNPWDDFEQLLDDLKTRKLTGNAARDAIANLSKQFDSTEWNEFCAAVLRRDLRTGCSESTINKVCKKTEYEVPTFGCQLATASAGRPEMRGKKRLDYKYDGMRVLLTVEFNGDEAGITCYSRNGKVYENFTHIEEQVRENLKVIRKLTGMKEGFVLDGEIMSSSFQALMTQARRQSGAKADDTVFHVFDIIPLEDFRRGYWNAQQRKRLEILDKIAYVIDKMANVVLVKGILVDLDTAAGRDQMDRYFSDALALGLEGIMVKDMEAPYECKRSVHWMKIKPVADFDLKVIQVVEGEGKYVGMMGALLCEGFDDGKLIRVSVGSGFSDEQRAEIWKNRRKALGQTAVVMCDAVTQSNTGEYSLRFPRFKTFRDDK